MGQPLVSVVIATYNMGQYVGAAIESVLAQTYPNVELLVVDDGSTDNTREIVQRYLGDSRVRYLSQKNAGQTVAKNAGIRASTGKYVGFCDADDQWMPDKLAKQVPVLEARPEVAVVYSKVSYIVEPPAPPVEELNIPCPSGKVTEDLYLVNFVPFGTALVRREALDRAGSFDEKYRMGIDWELWLRISLHWEFVFIDEPTYIYRVWAGQMSNNWTGRYEQCFRIMRDFETRNPGAVSRERVREAWAHSYASRARIRSYQSRQHLAACADLFRSLALRPGNFGTWRLIGRLAANAVGLRAP
jgi:glycosyltransferase involved in cell wall biosynthesis